jgi:hypothetical protein
LSQREWNTDAENPSFFPLNSNFEKINYFPRASWIEFIRNYVLSALPINDDSFKKFCLISLYFIIFNIEATFELKLCISALKASFSLLSSVILISS